MKKYVSLLLYVVILMFALLVFLYKPSIKNQNSTQVDNFSLEEKITPQKGNSEDFQSSDLKKEVEISEKITIPETLVANEEAIMIEKIEQDVFKNDIKVISGTISGTVTDSMRTAGVPQNVIGNFLNIFSYGIDFKRDVKVGDRFKVAYAVKLDPKGKIVKTGHIIYAEMVLGKHDVVLYGFKDDPETLGYYNSNGISLDKSENLQGNVLNQFKENIETINEYIYKNKPIQNLEIYLFDNIKVKRLVIKSENTKLLENLQKRLPKNTMQAIDSIEVEINNEKRYSANVYIKHGYEYGYKNIAYQIVQEILNILLAEGRSPFHEHMSVFAYVNQKVKGVTGQNIVNPLGSAHYDYTNDTIQWKDWKRGLFF